MICKPCQNGVHEGDPVRTAELFAEGKFDMRPLVCPGGTWCDCQHKTPIERVMKEKVDRWTVDRWTFPDAVEE